MTYYHQGRLWATSADDASLQLHSMYRVAGPPSLKPVGRRCVWWWVEFVTPVQDDKGVAV